MHVRRLPIVVLQHVAERAVQHARLAERRRVVASVAARAAGLDADQVDVRSSTNG